MMRHTVLLAFAGMLSAAVPGGLNAQSTPAMPAVERTITLDVVVTAKHGKEPVAGLKKAEFGVLDNGQPVSSISFRELHAGEQPVRAIVVVDALNIRVQGLQYVRDQVETFLKKNEVTVPMELAILTDKGMQAQQGFSTDGPGMAAQLGKQQIAIRDIPRSTGVYGAGERFDLSIHGLVALLDRVKALPGRTLVLWVSPGWPILSGPGIDLSVKDQSAIFARVVALSTAMREAHVTLYAIDPIGAGESIGQATYYENYLKPVTKSSQVDLGDESLQVLALQSGGLYLNSSAVGQMLTQSLGDAQHFYEISFPMAPVEKTDTFRSVTVTLANPDLVARTRDGYYAQP